MHELWAESRFKLAHTAEQGRKEKTLGRTGMTLNLSLPYTHTHKHTLCEIFLLFQTVVLRGVWDAMVLGEGCPKTLFRPPLFLSPPFSLSLPPTLSLYFP